jgi:hypothetical protein
VKTKFIQLDESMEQSDAQAPAAAESVTVES